MQINNINFSNIDNNKASFKSAKINSQNTTEQEQYQTVPAENSRAYASPQIDQNYKLIQTIDVPYVGKGKVYELTNGHKVILVPKAGPTAIYTSVGVGQLNEPKPIKEVSHLLEHLLASTYLGNKIPEVDEIIERTGAEYNASTSNYCTSYYLKAPIEKTEDLEDLIKVQAKTIHKSDFKDNDINDQKAIIAQELDSGKFATRNYLLTQKMTLKNLFNLKNTDDMMSQTTNKTLQNIKKEDLTNYYNNFYTPKNMVTTIVGTIDDKTINTVEKYFGKTQPEKPILDTTYPKLTTDNLIKNTVRQDVISLDKETNRTSVNLSFIGPSNEDSQENLKLEAVKKIIRKRLEKASKGSENKSEFKIYSDTISSNKNDPSILTVLGSCKNHITEQNLKILFSMLYNITQNPVGEEELNEMKKSFDDDTSYGKESAMDIAEIFSDMTITSQSIDEKKYLKEIHSLTSKDIQETAQKYIDLNKASLVVVHPYKTPFDKVKKVNEISSNNNAQATSENSSTKTPSYEGKINNVSFKGKTDQTDSKDIHEYILPNNLRLILDSRPGIAKTTVSFNLHSQKTILANPEAGPGLSAFLKSEETNDIMEKENINLYSNANTQEITTKLSGDSDKTLEMIGYAAGIALNPDLNPEVFEDCKTKALNRRNAQPDKPIYTALKDELYKENPYHYTENDLNGLNIDDIKNLHEQILNNAQGTVVVTIPKEKLAEMKGQIFDILMKVPELQPYNHDAIFNKIEFKPLEKTKLFTQTQDSSQIEVSQYFKIIESGNIKDKAGLMILNEALGGSNKALLFKHLRDNDKISYSANSGYFTNKNTGKMSEIELFTTVGASSENLHKVIEEYNNCLNELTSKPISLEELAKIKTKLKSEIIYKTESFPGKNHIVNVGYKSFYGSNYQEALLDSIDKMTPEYVQELAKHYLTQPSLYAVSGNKEVLEAEKDYLAKIGEVTNLESN